MVLQQEIPSTIDWSQFFRLFCNHSHFLGYHYTGQALHALSCVNSAIAKEVGKTNKLRKGALLEIVRSKFGKNTKFDQETLVFDPFYTVCRWKQNICRDHLFIFDESECLKSKMEHGAFFRAQLTSRKFEHPGANLNDPWPATQEMRLYGAFIDWSGSSKQRHMAELLAQQRVTKPDWEGVYWPNRAKEVNCKLVNSVLFFNKYPNLAYYVNNGPFEEVNANTLISCENSIDENGNYRTYQLYFKIDDKVDYHLTQIKKKDNLYSLRYVA